MKTSLTTRQRAHIREKLLGIPCSRTSTHIAQPTGFCIQLNSEKKKFPEVMYGYSAWPVASVEAACLGH